MRLSVDVVQGGGGMKRGDRGEDVILLQGILNLANPENDLLLDGIFGPKTQNALFETYGVSEADKTLIQGAIVRLVAREEKLWRHRAVTQAMNDWGLNINEKTERGREWIARNIIQPGWDKKTADIFAEDSTTFQYCGLTMERWWCSAGLPQTTQNLASPGRVIKNFAERDGMGTVLQKTSPLRPADAVLRRSTPNSWKGHVMMGIAAGEMRTKKGVVPFVLVAEGNSSNSFGPDETGERLTKRQGVGLRLVPLNTQYVACFVSPDDYLFPEV